MPQDQHDPEAQIQADADELIADCEYACRRAAYERNQGLQRRLRVVKPATEVYDQDKDDGEWT